MEFTKEQTQIAKGVAICLMMIYHLFNFSDRILNGNSYIPLIPFFNIEAEVASFGSICVSMLLFLSGYGMSLGYVHSKDKLLIYSIKKLRDFYFTYWLYFLIFVPIGLLYFQEVTVWGTEDVRYLSDPKTFLENFLGWSSIYNADWWFIRIFVMSLIFLFPLYTKLADKNIALVASVSLFLLALSSKVNNYGHLGFTYWQTSFALGIICAKVKFFSTSRLIKPFDKASWVWIFLGLLLCLILRLMVGGTEIDFLIVPFFIYFSCKAVAILNLSKLIAYLGRYSFPLWLIHSFFCYYYFQDIIYFPKWSPFVFILLTTVSLLSVLAIENFRSYVLHLTKAWTGQIKKI